MGDAVSRRDGRRDAVVMSVALAGFIAVLVVAGGAGCGSTGAGGTGGGGESGRGGTGTGGESGRGGAGPGGAGGGGATGAGGSAAGTGGAGGATAGTGGAGGAAGTGGAGGAAGTGGAGGAAGTGGAAARGGGPAGTGGAGGGAGTGGGGAGAGGAGGGGGGTWRIPVPTAPVRRVALGGQRACALSPNGVARCWGSDTDLYSLMLGGSYPFDRAAPVDMTPLIGQHVVDIAVTNRGMCALKDEGSVFCNGEFTNQIVSGIDGPAVQFCAGPVSVDFSFWCALRADGKVFCWADSSSVNPLGGPGPFWATEAIGVDDAVSVACGNGSACAVKRDGTAWCWGGGRGTPKPSNPSDGELPRLVPELGREIATLQAGEGGICAFARSGAATCFGTLFTPTNSFPLPPPRTVPELNGARAVAIGDRHVCATGADGAVRCWGANDFGQLANGTFVAHAAPALATALGGGGAGGSGGGGAIAEVVAGEGVTCASFAGGAVRCVGSNDRGALGDGSALSLSAVPVALAAGASVASYKAAAVEKTGSALLSDGSVVAWGAVPSVIAPAAGPPLRAAAPLPFATSPLPPAAVQAFVTDVSACLRAADGAVRCLKTAPPAGTPATFDIVPGFESGALELDANCAVPASGGVKCGIGIAGVTPFAQPGSASMGAVADIGIGYSGGCLLRPDGTVECWVGTKTVPVQELGGPVVAVAVGDDGCALRQDGAVLCWRMDDFLPPIAERVQLPAAAVGITAASGVFCRRYMGGFGCYADDFNGHACAWTAAGDLYCWGGNAYGQLGDGTTTARTGVVSASAPGGPILSASAGTRQTCALRTADRRLVCWGWNGAGELGTGTGGPRATSSTVVLP
jgi:alpha-tubulin suppressor-like RCC1 family protein